MWRWMHGAAYEHDRRRSSNTICATWLRALHPVLPCGACRASFGPVLAAADVEAAGREHRLGELVFGLHNAVNVKLNRPELENYAIVERRSQVWPVQFTEAEVFAVLFIVVLNYAANKEPKKPAHYKRFVLATEELCRELGRLRAAEALAKVALHRARPTEMFHQLHRAYELWAETRVSRYELRRRYELCRSQK